MRKLRVLSIVITVLLAVSLAACGTVRINLPAEYAQYFFGGASQNAAPADATVPASADDTTAPAPAADTTAPAPAGDTTAPAPAADTTAPAPAADTTAPAPAVTEPPKSGAPSTKEEIINYYVTAYNKIASESKSVVRTYDYTYQYNDILEINNNATLEKLAGTLMNQFMKENTQEVPGDASSLPPVGVTKLAISPAQISKATCEDKGDHYEVCLYSTGSDGNWEIDSQAGVGSAGVIGPLLRTEDVSGAAGSLIKFEGLHTWYSTAHVTAQIDKATGHITEFDFKTPCVLHFDSVTAAIVVKVSNCNLGMEFHQVWKVTY